MTCKIVLSLLPRNKPIWRHISRHIARSMAHALKTFYCRGTLDTRVNPDTIGCVWTGEFDLNTLRVDGDFCESGKKNLRIQKYPDTCGRGLIRRSPRSAKIARCARCSDCDFRRSPRSAYKIADIWHVRYRRLNSPAFPKCARSRDFLRLLLRIASKANPSGWAFLSHEFSKLPHRRDRRKKSPGVSASIGGENRL